MDQQAIVEVVIALWQRKEWIVLVALLVGLVMRVVKDPRVPIPMPARFRPLFVVLTGQVIAVADGLVTGLDWKVLVGTGLSASFLAIMGHVFGIEVARDGKELFQKRPETSNLHGLVIVLVVGSLGVGAAGCESPRTTAVYVANATRDVGMQAKQVLHEECTLEYSKTSSMERIAALDKKCLPFAALYRGVRGAHLALVAGIQAYDVWGDPFALMPLLERAAKATRLVAEAVVSFGEAVDR